MIAMRQAMAAVLLAAACGDNMGGEVGPDAALLLPDYCDGWEALTTDVPEVGEVRVGGILHTPGISYVAADGTSTWTYHVRRWGDRLGSYGTYEIGTERCRWADVIEERTPATGQR